MTFGPPPPRPRSNHGQAVPAVAKPAVLDARKAQRFGQLPKAERMELAALEIRSIAYAVQECAEDDRLRGGSTGVRLTDARELHRLATWAEYDARLARWRDLEWYAKAEDIAMKIGDDKPLPPAVAKAMKTRPVAPQDDPSKGYVRPEAGPVHAPALPNAHTFVAWDVWLPAFLAARAKAIAGGWKP